MMEELPRSEGKVVGIRVTGQIKAEDYEKIRPLLEGKIERYGKIRLLIELEDIEGMDLAAMWEDVKFDTKHMNDLERCAMVGESKWQEYSAKLFKPFTSAEVKYFDKTQNADAWRWVSEAGPEDQPEAAPPGPATSA